ncbi:ABC transporter permease subunit [Naumannella cuiyingiana]|uniref:Peptide/nickel transport system permease protein n=1 Tax=Naumannella cuiyingiana TaxID=1347891 RepID=A0A7Z0DAY5_9ACTN|nr:peptide/nickel transport system permease protein [Naumannella cuiyingiana]
MTILDQRLTAAAPAAARVRAARVRRRLRVRPTVVLAIAWLAVVLLAALAPGLIAPGDPYAANGADSLLGPSPAHPFGTDQIGRDLLTRVVHGTGLSVQATLVAVGFGLVAGGLLGLLAGTVGGWLDQLAMRFVDVLMAFPALLLSLAFITALGFGTLNVAIAVGAGSIAASARVMRAQVMRVRLSPFVEAAATSGARRLTILRRHVLPHAIGPVLVLAVLDFGTAMLAVSSLSFLGFGAQPPTPEWGSLVAGGRSFLGSAWWLSTLPGLVVVATVLSANRLARALEGNRR